MVAIGAGRLIAWWMDIHQAAAPVVLSEQIRIPPPVVIEPSVPAPVSLPVHSSVQPPMARGGINPAEAADSLLWEQKLDSILMAGGEANDKADAIRKLMTVAPAGAEVELAQHLINMTQDDHYDGAAELLTNATTPAAVATVLMNDLLNRRNTLKLPMLLAIARNDEHPLKDQAKDMLELFLQADYSTNWEQWSGAVDTWLQDNQ